MGRPKKDAAQVAENTNIAENPAQEDIAAQAAAVEEPAAPAQENAAPETPPTPEDKDALTNAQTDDLAEEKTGEATGEPLFAKSEVEAMIAEATAKAVADALANAQTAPKAAAPDDMVTVAYLAEVSPESELVIPGYGSMRPQSYIEVPKKEFGNKFMSSLVRKLIDKRHLIVMSGLTQDERERWNCDYKAGEVLDERTFDKMLDYPTPKLAEIFEKLCPEHQRFVARRMITAKEKGDNRISVEKARRINDLSKKNDPAGMLKPVLEAFGAEMAR